ncbi:MAG: CRISPR-associated endonuclease Cas1 [Polyangiaceae bacterium]|nr:CRISPR-associated endonuclease Cas1 [Polyangiaceae bacterium]MCW5790475.1 CRISPR-associated endonuclease Cas1 [Polyangiaceae bacterium]
MSAWPGDAGEVQAAAPLVPSSVVLEVLYCERAVHIAWVQGEWDDNEFTRDGAWVHRKVDKPRPLKRPKHLRGKEDAPEEPERPYQARSVWLSSPSLGVTAKTDVVSVDGGSVVPIEYKRGRQPSVLEGALLEHRAQLCCQVLLLREQGYTCDHGEIYYAEDKRRVVIEITEGLIATTMAAIARAKELYFQPKPPPPLYNSPKCRGCSLVGICLPDETNHLGAASAEPVIIPARAKSLPLAPSRLEERPSVREPDQSLPSADAEPTPKGHTKVDAVPGASQRTPNPLENPTDQTLHPSASPSLPSEGDQQVSEQDLKAKLIADTSAAILKALSEGHQTDQPASPGAPKATPPTPSIPPASPSAPTARAEDQLPDHPASPSAPKASPPTPKASPTALSEDHSPDQPAPPIAPTAPPTAPAQEYATLTPQDIAAGAALRRLHPARDDKAPLLVQEHGARVGLDGELLKITSREGTVTTARLPNTSHVALYGNAQISTQAVVELLRRGIPVCYFSTGGYYLGRTLAHDSNQVSLRVTQYDVLRDDARRLELAAGIISSKIANARTLVRRNATGDTAVLLRELKILSRKALRASSQEELLGIEGTAARAYFSALPNVIRPPDGSTPAFDWNGRNRRPPTDPINAMLSLCYTMLTKDFTLAIQLAGLDAMFGFYHQVRFGRPSLALDLMEEFRPIVADSIVIKAINTGEITAADFIHQAGSCTLTHAGRRRLLGAYERRLGEEVTHPTFGYRISYRRVLEVQARLFARVIGGELPSYPAFRTR